MWEYFVEVSPGKAQCNICDKIISMGSATSSGKNTTNLWSHLKHVHPEASEEAKKKKDTKDPSQPSVSQLFDKKTEWKNTDPRSVRIDAAVTEMIAVDNQPFSVVSDIGFKRLVTLMEPRYRIKDEKFYRTKMLDETYSRVLTKVKSLVKQDKAPFMAFTTDCWSGTTESLMSLTGHFISEDWSRMQVMLNVKPMTGSHTGSYIQETFLKMLEDWDIAPERVVLVLRDGGANMVKGMTLAELPHVSCTAHTLQLIINDGLSSQRAVLDIIGILKNCATHFGHSVLAKQRLKTIQEELGLPVHTIIQAVQTRWNSTLHMLQRMYEQRRALNVYAGEHGHISCLSASQWDIVCNLIDTLTPLEEITLEMSHSESSAACIIPSVSVLKLMLQAEGPYTGGIKTLRKTMLDSLSKRFSKAEETKCLVLATLLDPRYKGHAFASEITLQNAKLWLQQEAEEHGAPREERPSSTAETPEGDEGSESDPEAKKQKMHQSTLLDTLYAKVLGATAISKGLYSFESELECYLLEPVIERGDNPLQWWQKNEVRFKTLAPMAKKFLCPPPSTVPSERVFSEVGIIYDSRRSRLTGHHAQQLCFLHYNLKSLKFEY